MWFIRVNGRKVLVDKAVWRRIKRNGFPIEVRAHSKTRPHQVYAYSHRHQSPLHRVIMDLPRGDKRVVDHINHNTLDNRRENLRICSHKQNAWNRRGFGSKAGYKGVQIKKGKFVAKIQVNGHSKYLGMFATAEEAARAYDSSARELCGEFALPNFPEIISTSAGSPHFDSRHSPSSHSG